MTREEAITKVKGYLTNFIPSDNYIEVEEIIKALEQEPCEDIGEVSDGYHTFNQLYHQRAVLFAAIVNQNKEKAWKSFKHSDGKYCFDSNGDWFIVGVDTPKGSYTYHYEKKYWDIFDCEELERGKVWDGHTEEDVTRLLSLEQELCEDCVSLTKEAYTDLVDKLEILDKRYGSDFYWEVRKIVDALSLVTSTHGTCKDCEHCGNKYANNRIYCSWLSNFFEEKFYCADFKKAR